MALEKMTDDGYLSWRCHRGAEKHPDSELITAHISHESLQYVSDSMVALPPCPSCAEMGVYSRCIVTVLFPPQERWRVGMQEEPGTTTQMLPHAETGEIVPVTVQTMVPVGPNPYLARHEALKAHLDKIGKVYTPPTQEKEK